jgi:phosphinothricin acetyltransferase
MTSSFGIANFATEDALRFFETRLKTQSEIFGIWVATCEDQVVGWQALQPCRNNPIEAFTGAESSTYVSPTSRGKGVGKALLQFAQDHAVRVGLREIRGNVAVTNFASLKLVDSLGWTRVGTLPQTQDDAHTFFLYVYAVPVRADWQLSRSGLERRESVGI